MLEQLRQELSNRKAELEQIKNNVRLLGTNIDLFFTEINDSILFRKFTPRNQNDIRQIPLNKPLIIDLSEWPAEREFVLDLQRRYVFIAFLRSQRSIGEVKVKLLNTHFLSQSFDGYNLGPGDFIKAWEKTIFPTSIPVSRRNNIGFFYGKKITMISAAASGSDSISNIQTRGDNND